MWFWVFFSQANQNAEVKIAKVAVMNMVIWLAIWAPYASVVIIALFWDKHMITPTNSQIPACQAKISSCFNPIVFALSHPK